MAETLSKRPDRHSAGFSFAPPHHATYNGIDSSLDTPVWDGAAPTSAGPPGQVDAPPAYSPSAVFTPTLFFQIDAQGKRLVSLPAPPAPSPIRVYAVTPDGLITGTNYVSLRANRRSGSCMLVDGADNSQVRTTTTYRFGPGRDPCVKLFTPPSAFLQGDTLDMDVGIPGEDEPVGWDAFELRHRNLLTRAVYFKTRLGAFEWRYATRKERKAAGADSLLVLDRVTKVALARNPGAAGPSKNQEEGRNPVAHFVRNDAFRTDGTSRSSAGNGGRLMIDLSIWHETHKADREMAVVLTVTTCISMLKKEVDRRRREQIAVMGALAS